MLKAYPQKHQDIIIQPEIDNHQTPVKVTEALRQLLIQ